MVSVQIFTGEKEEFCGGGNTPSSNLKTEMNYSMVRNDFNDGIVPLWGDCRLYQFTPGTKGLYAQIKKKAEQRYTIPGSRRTKVAEETISSWLKKYHKGGFDALQPKTSMDNGKARRRPLKVANVLQFGGEFEAHLIALACSEAPEGRSRWTVRLLAEKMVELQIVSSVSPMTVCKTLKKINLSLTKANTGRYRPTKAQVMQQRMYSKFMPVHMTQGFRYCVWSNRAGVSEIIPSHLAIPFNINMLRHSIL